MKKIIIILIAWIAMNGSLHGQIHLFLEEQEVTLPDGKSSAWVFPIAMNLEEALDDLKEYCKNRSDVKFKKDGENILIAEKISMPAISTLRGDLIGYAYITEQYYAMALVFKLGYDISVNSKDWKAEMENLHNYAKAFMAYHYEQTYARRVESLEKELKDVERERNQTEGKISNMNDKVSNLGKKIAKETDTGKIGEYEAEINTLEADAKQLMDTLPGLESKIAELKRQVDRNKAESNAYLSTIATF
jgi:hypothetical protein